MHVTAHPSILYCGTPVALLSTLNEDGTANLAPMSSVFWLGYRAFLGLQSTSLMTAIRDAGRVYSFAGHKASGRIDLGGCAAGA